MIRLLLGSKLGTATIYPWRIQLKSGLNALTRALFVVLLTASIAVDAFAWNWIWLAPPVLAILLNLKHARKIPGRTRADLVIAGIRRDGWARQYKAEGLPSGQTRIAVGEVI
jgi:membrane-associated phospholipid phosphatase